MTETPPRGLPLTHPSIDLTAPVEYWQALAETWQHGLSIQQYNPENRFAAPRPGDPWELYLDGMSTRGLTALLLQAISHGVGLEIREPDGRYAIIWAIDELNRRAEERARVSALTADAKAIEAFAAAMTGAAYEAVLQQILSRLSERTQFAVRTQLAGSSV
jgi:hypothetical protein